MAALIFSAHFFRSFLLRRSSRPGWCGVKQSSPARRTAAWNIVETRRTARCLCAVMAMRHFAADSARLDYPSGEVVADGHVRIEEGDQIWSVNTSANNFKTHQMQSEQFAWQPPVFAQGGQLQATRQYNLPRTHAFVTTDDVSDPAIRVRSSHINCSGKYVEMWTPCCSWTVCRRFTFRITGAIWARTPTISSLPATAAPTGRFCSTLTRGFTMRGRKDSSGLPREAGVGRGAGPESAPRSMGRGGVQVLFARPTPKQQHRHEQLREFWVMPENRQRFYLVTRRPVHKFEPQAL